MKRTKPQTVQAAILLHEQLVGKRPRNEAVYLPTHGWDCIQAIQRQIEMARAHGWHAAVKRLHEDLAATLSDFHRQLEISLRQLQTTSRVPCRKASVTDIHRDLLALEDEFDGFKLDLSEKELSVTTDTIVLEGIYLGPFQIRLEWCNIGQASPAYRVIALEPHPATKSDEITHPHVQGERLCEGEGRAAIAAALAEGRFFDFFVLVSQVLHNYGRGSAYVELDNWEGEPCFDCGDYVDPDDRYSCHRCDTVLCAGCAYTCQGCDESFCSDCIGTCARCGCKSCFSCLEDCKDCGQPVCDDCRKTCGLCTRCHEKQEKEHEHDATEDDLQPEPVAATA